MRACVGTAPPPIIGSTLLKLDAAVGHREVPERHAAGVEIALGAGRQPAQSASASRPEQQNDGGRTPFVPSYVLD